MVESVPRILEGRGRLVQNASVAATELIRQAILDGRLEPGSRLKEEELARELGISRTPVREALLMLQAEGLIETTPNRGAVVRTHDADDLIDLYQLRALLEGYAARQAATRFPATRSTSCARAATVSTASTATTSVSSSRRTSGSTARSTFAAGSARLSGMVRRVIELPLVYRSYVWYSPTRSGSRRTTTGRSRTRSSVRDAERAELVMREHIFEARDLLVATSATQPEA